jgi:hypothetical protein
MEFHVPQFIEVEDKIFGPFSAKQFMYMGGAGGAFFIFYSLTHSLFLGILLSSPIVALGLALAFYKINNRPFIYMLEAAFRYFTNSSLYVWKKIPKKATPQKKEEASDQSADANLFVPKLSDSKLKDLAWSLDIQEGGVYESDKK